MEYIWLVFVLFLLFDLIKAGATQTETSLLKQHAAGERVDLLDGYDFPARTITEMGASCSLDAVFRSFYVRTDYKVRN